ncbi:MAG: dephospho-CoA kinase [Ilumatobacteraceae bacterium]
MGLTGGIGSGKSTVSALLAERGAVIVDADQVVRDVQQPGSPVLAKMAERFGPQVIAADGSLDRAAVASVVFTDPEALKALNAIVHPAVGAEMNRQVMAERDGDRVVVMDIPLLTENPRDGLQAVIVVDVDPECRCSGWWVDVGSTKQTLGPASRSRPHATSGSRRRPTWSTTAARSTTWCRRSTVCGRR